MKKSIVILTLILTAVFTAHISALPSAEDRTLQRAKKYAENGHVEDALNLINPLLEAYPTDYKLLSTVFEIYRDAKDFDNALKFLERCRKISTNAGRIYLDYADLFMRQGEIASADSALQIFIGSRGRGQNAYKEAAQTWLKNGYYSEATVMYERGREKLADSLAFALELGSLYQRQRQYHNAVHEYFKFMEGDTLNIKTGEAQLTYLVNNIDETGELKKALAEVIANDSLNYMPRRFYADLLLREGLLDSAFEYYKIVDRLHRKNGQYIFHFSNLCLENQEFEMAARACRYLVADYSDKGFYGMAQLNLATAFLNMNKADSAIVIYHQLIRIQNDPRTRVEGEFLLGRTFLEKLYRTDSARYYFNRVLKAEGSAAWADRVNMGIAETYIVDDRLDLADSLLLSVNTNRLQQEDKERLLFERAQIRFFKGEYSDARGLYNLLVGVHPRSLLVNDCLRKMLIIDENTGMDILDLEIYSQAERLMWQNRADSALGRLVDLSGRGQSSLSAMATFQAGEIFYSRGEYQKALEFFNKVLEGFSDSFYTAESQKYLGDLYYYHFNDSEKAREAYHLILENYPNKVLYEYARRQLRKIENS